MAADSVDAPLADVARESAQPASVQAQAEPAPAAPTPQAQAAPVPPPAPKAQRRKPTEKQPGKRISAEEFPYRVGDIIVGKVRWANNRGARIDIEGFSAVQGYMPRNRGPVAIRSGSERNRFADYQMGTKPCMIKNCVRKFRTMAGCKWCPFQSATVVFVPEDMSSNGKGPILSCDELDNEILWQRVRQVGEIGRKMRETIRIPIHGAVERGLLGSFCGLRGFIPVSHIPKEPNTWLAPDDLKAKYVGKDVEVAILNIAPEKGSFSASINNANSDRTLRRLTIGSLVWGTVRRIQHYGVFVAIDGTYESALLHIANISWHRVENCEEVFEEGDRVRAVIIGMDEGFTRLSISTRDLEGSEGDMLENKEMVYEDAEVNVQRFLEHVAKWEAEAAAKEEQEAGAAA